MSCESFKNVHAVWKDIKYMALACRITTCSSCKTWKYQGIWQLTVKIK